jgi:hypothetical protein
VPVLPPLYPPPLYPPPLYPPPPCPPTHVVTANITATATADDMKAMVFFCGRGIHYQLFKKKQKEKSTST